MNRPIGGETAGSGRELPPVESLVDIQDFVELWFNGRSQQQDLGQTAIDSQTEQPTDGQDYDAGGTEGLPHGANTALEVERINDTLLIANAYLHQQSEEDPSSSESLPDHVTAAITSIP